MNNPDSLYRRLDERISVRWPHFAVLQPLFLLGYVVAGSLLAFGLAYLTRGTLEQPFHSKPVTMAFLVISTGTALRWGIRQWQERAALLRWVRPPGAWGFFPTFVFLALFFFPAFVWENASLYFVSRLLPESDLRALYVVADGDRAFKPEPPLWANRPALQSSELLVHFDHGSCAVLGDPVLSSAVKRTLTEEAVSALVRECQTVPPSLWTHQDELFSEKTFMRNTVGRGLREALVYQYEMRTVPDTAEVMGATKIQIPLAYLLAFGATMLGLAGIVPGLRLLSVVLSTFIGGAMLAVTLSILRVHPWQDNAVSASWVVFFALCLAPLLAGVVPLLFRRRTRWSDLALIVLWVAPLALVLIPAFGIDMAAKNDQESGFDGLFRATQQGNWVGPPTTVGVAVRTLAGIYGVCSLLTAAAFGRFRRLPLLH